MSPMYICFETIYNRMCWDHIEQEMFCQFYEKKKNAQNTLFIALMFNTWEQ